MTESNREGQLSTADVAYGTEENRSDKEPIDGTDERNDRAETNRTEAEKTDGGRTATDAAPLMPEANITSFREQWQVIQTRFVDEPKESVRDADALVAEVIQTLAKSFADQRQDLEGQWGRGSDVSTEDLRQALQQYRSFFQRLLTT
jgi:hypothetical protein